MTSCPRVEGSSASRILASPFPVNIFGGQASKHATQNNGLECKSEYVPKNTRNILKQTKEKLKIKKSKKERGKWPAQHHPGHIIRDYRGAQRIKGVEGEALRVPPAGCGVSFGGGVKGGAYYGVVFFRGGVCRVGGTLRVGFDHKSSTNKALYL